jgi:hypothetical protein
LDCPVEGQPPSRTFQENHENFAFTASEIPDAPFSRGLLLQSTEGSKNDLEGFLTSLFGLSNVTLAFEKTVGSWSPDWQNHRVAEERNIYFEPTSHLFDAYLSNPRALSALVTVSSDTRDDILAIILKNCARDNLTTVASAFPSAKVMSQLLLRFLESHALEEDTWIHVSTFDVNHAPPELLMACVASSALGSTSSAIRRFGKALHSVLHPYLFQVVSPPYNLI